MANPFINRPAPRVVITIPAYIGGKRNLLASEFAEALTFDINNPCGSWVGMDFAAIRARALNLFRIAKVDSTGMGLVVA